MYPPFRFFLSLQVLTVTPVSPNLSRRYEIQRFVSESTPEVEEFPTSVIHTTAERKDSGAGRPKCKRVVFFASLA